MSLSCARFRSSQAVLCVSLSCLLMAAPVAMAAPVQVTLNAAASPTAASPGTTPITIFGSGFPTGSISPANVTVTLNPATAGAGPSGQGPVTSVTSMFGSSDRVVFPVPQGIIVSTPTAYLVSIQGSTSSGTTFASVNSSSVTINPLPSLGSLSTISGRQGQTLSVQITGNYTNFFQGSTVASFGPGISVGQAAEGVPGPVTVNGPTSATASITIDSAAAPGARTVAVQTGIEGFSSANAFTVNIAQVSVPNVVGDTQAAATSAITAAKLVVGTVTQQSSSSVAKGNVISESPTAGTSVNAGSAVNLVVSSGPAQVSVPNVVGDTQAAATTAITAAKLVVGTVTQQSSSSVAKGNVISENPTAGTTVNAGSAVNLVVSSGLGQVSVPNVVGDTQAAATTAITSANLVVGTVTQQSSSSVAKGDVISENPTAGTTVNAGSAVNLVISSGPAQVSVPNVVGDTQAAATSAITSANLVVGTVTQQSSNSVAKGNVISENPTAGTTVNAGSAVNLVVSSGPAQVSVPNVVGDTQAAATSAITSASLVVGTVTQQSSSSVAKGNVISENPTAGTTVNVGSAVNLVISSGPAQVSVPNVVGDTQAAATSAITSANLVVGTVTQQSSSSVPSGDVISENPTAGTTVNAGSAVNLVVSSGAAQVSVPNVVGDTQAAATSAITSANLVVGTVTQQSSSSVAKGNVISENPTAGTSVNAGSAVNLVVSSGPAQVSVPNVVGDTQAAATTAITGASLVVGTVTQQSSSSVAKGDVISENPTAGTTVNVGSAVNLVVSSGPAQVSVPNVVGDTQAAATSAITSANLVVGTVTQQSSSSVAKGNVISENPTAGTTVNAGSAVNLVISSGPAQVSVPNVVGDTQAAATTAITGASLVVGTVTQQSSSSVAKGDVISENPTAGTTVNAGSAVNLVVSSGPAQVSVPNVVGDTQAAATTTITSANLVVGTVTQQSSSSVAKGDVISESPTAGTTVNAGSAVNLVISSGPAQVSVPNVVGDTQAAATSAITTANLVVGTVTQQSSSSVAKGNVISESPTAGTTVNVGSAVNLVISSGPAQVSVPNVVGDTQAAATSAITSANLVVGTVTQQSSSSVPSGDVISENPTAGTTVNVGSAVNLVISSGSGSDEPASIQVSVSAQVVAPNSGSQDTNGIVTVSAVALDGNGHVINPSPTFTFNITAVGATSGNTPVLSGNTITFPKLNKKLTNQNKSVDPNGLYADTDPSDPNFGKQTGGVYQVTASISSPSLVSPPVQVVVIPSSSATVTAETYDYSNQLDSALSQIYTAYGNTGHSGLNAAKTALGNVIANVNFSAQVLQKNQVLAPPDGRLITPDLLTGFSPSPDDPAYTSTISTLRTEVQNATTQVNGLNTTNPTMAQVAAIQAATAAYKTTLTQLKALKPSAIELATESDQINQLYASDIPTLLDAIGSQVNALASPFSGKLRKLNESPVLMARMLSRMHLAPQFLDIFFVGFGACFDLVSQAENNIITLTVSLAQDIINLEAAGIINANAPPGMTIEDVIASSSLSFASPCYPDTEVDGFGFDPNPAVDSTLVVGAANSGNIGNLLTLSVPKGIGQAITLINTLQSTARSLSQTLNFSIIQTPDQFILGGGIFSDGSDALIFDNGWPQVNQSSIPAVGLIVVTNGVDGTFAATNIDFVAGSGSCQ